MYSKWETITRRNVFSTNPALEPNRGSNSALSEHSPPWRYLDHPNKPAHPSGHSSDSWRERRSK